MKKVLVLSLLATVGMANAVVFTDPTGDVQVPGSPWPHIDITAVEVTNDATNISFAFTLNGDPAATNWGKYNVILRRVGAASLDTSFENNPWGRKYGLVGGSSGFIGSWVDQATNNQQNFSYNSGWNMNIQTTNFVDGPNKKVVLTTSLASLGLAVGNTIIFDAITTGGGPDTAVDSLTGAVPTAWDQHVDLQGHTYQVVPEPGTIAALGLGVAALLRRKKK